jgi:non-specific serine/threonine protein kinase
VAPLALPAAGVDLGAVRDSEAVRLLMERATLTRHDLRLDDDAYATAARICQELDGLPLAIELAAARTKALSLDEIAERLRDRFQFLVSWRRLTAARHRTLREAMDWSYELLGPEEQLLLGRLSVFPAGANLGSIAAVCLPGDEASAEALIERLVDASLVVAVESALGTRYRLLETVRQYAAERVPPSDLPALQRRHAERTLAVVEPLNLGLESESHASRFDLARAELPSIRAAIQWSTIAEPSLGIDIASALERFWAITQARESIPMFNALLAGDVPDAQQARALRCRGGCRYASGDFAGGVEDYEEALAIHRRLGQRAHQAHLLMRLAMDAQRVGDAARARRLVEEAEMVGGEARFAPDRYVGLGLESDLAFHDGRVDEGFEILDRARTRAAEAGDTMWHMDALLRMSERAFENGRLDEAGSAAREALALARDIDDRQSVIWTLGILARLAATIGSHHRAARLWGALESEVERGGPVGQWELESDVYRRAVEDRAGPGFRPGVAEGRALTLPQAIEEALGRP